MKYSLLFGLCFLLACYQNQTNNSDIKETTSLKSYYAFINDVLIGQPFQIIKEIMAKSPHQYLGEDQRLINYETTDQHQVIHFITFVGLTNQHLESYTYHLDFRNADIQQMNYYENNLKTNIEAIFGSDFEVGYDTNGLLKKVWISEAVKVEITQGTNFITLDLYQY